MSVTANVMWRMPGALAGACGSPLGPDGEWNLISSSRPWPSRVCMDQTRCGRPRAPRWCPPRVPQPTPVRRRVPASATHCRPAFRRATRPPKMGTMVATSPRPSSRSLLARDIVGRDGCLLRLREALNASVSECEVIALVGEAGLGKTRLLRALVAQAREEGRVVLVGRASPLEAALPMGVLIDALRAERRTRPEAPAPADPLAAALPSLLLPEVGSD